MRGQARRFREANKEWIMNDYERVKARAQAKSEDGCCYHVNCVIAIVNGQPSVVDYTISDWSDGTTVATFSNGKEL
jgi:hypothetical protein